jgi:hypothetical protein
MLLSEELHSMRRHLLAAGIAAATLIPTLAMAQQTCEQQRNTRVTGTVAGAGLGALLGSVVAGKGDRTTGAVVGGLGGALVGNQISKGKADCANAYGYYDNNGAWHATGVDRAQARGYYSRDGQWVEGAPNGYYNAQNQWVQSSTSASASGYYDRNNQWVPASSNGYYDTRGQWVAGAASGYYDNGRWVSGPATGRYDSNGRWVPGQAAGRRDANGAWITDAQPGYYDANGRWRAGEARGYYDTQGRWIATAPSADSRGTNASYGDRSNMDGPRDFRSRETRLQQRIRAGMNDGSLSRAEADRALRSLAAIRREEAGLRHYQGRLGQRDEVRIQAKLDTLSDSIRWSRQDRRDNY